MVLTPTHLAIAMEYAAGGELFERICSAGRFSEDEVSLAFGIVASFASMQVLFRMILRVLYVVFASVDSLDGMEEEKTFQTSLIC